MPNLYVISGCNGAGKTTASYTVLPEMLNCNEFINADEIAKGLSPFNPDKAAIEAGRIMLTRIAKLLQNGSDFAFETTLATKSYRNVILIAKANNYKVILLYFWLDSVDLAIRRVNTRVAEGGHNIPEKVIHRRYFAGISNFFSIYFPIADYWMLFNNSEPKLELIAEGVEDSNIDIKNNTTFELIKSLIR